MDPILIAFSFLLGFGARQIGLYLRSLILTAVGPLSDPDGHDFSETFDEAVPGLASGIDDGIISAGFVWLPRLAETVEELRFNRAN